MKDFAGKMAVVTGGGTGMGRELARQLIAEGCSVAMCDVSARNMAETIALCQTDGVPQGARITAHIADVSDEDQLIDEAVTWMGESGLRAARDPRRLLGQRARSGPFGFPSGCAR